MYVQTSLADSAANRLLENHVENMVKRLHENWGERVGTAISVAVLQVFNLQQLPHILKADNAVTAQYATLYLRSAAEGAVDLAVMVLDNNDRAQELVDTVTREVDAFTEAKAEATRIEEANPDTNQPPTMLQ